MLLSNAVDLDGWSNRRVPFYCSEKTGGGGYTLSSENKIKIKIIGKVSLPNIHKWASM